MNEITENKHIVKVNLPGGIVDTICFLQKKVVVQTAQYLPAYFLTACDYFPGP